MVSLNPAFIPEFLDSNVYISVLVGVQPSPPSATRLAIAFYYYNLIGGNYADTFGNTVTPVSANTGGGNKRGMGLGVDILPQTN